MASYDEACAFHCTQQGLDPVLKVLTDAGLKAVLEQTGGFVMTVGVYDVWEPSTYVWITSADQYDGGPGYLVIKYHEDDRYNGEGDILATHAELTSLPELVRGSLNL